MVRNESILDRPLDSSATFKGTETPSGASEGICQIRILAPLDVSEKIAELIEPFGLAMSGSEPENGYENRYRTYFVVSAKRFSQAIKKKAAAA